MSLPGYKRFQNLNSVIAFDKENEDSYKSGGTAIVRKGKLKTAHMIRKIGLVDVAVKTIYGDRFVDTAVYESFLYEVSIMATLPESPHIVRFIGYCENPMSIIMKFYSMNLQELIDSNVFFSDPAAKMKATIEIAKGMSIVHSKNIIHFDLKPGKHM